MYPSRNHLGSMTWSRKFQSGASRTTVYLDCWFANWFLQQLPWPFQIPYFLRAWALIHGALQINDGLFHKLQTALFLWGSSNNDVHAMSPICTGTIPFDAHCNKTVWLVKPLRKQTTLMKPAGEPIVERNNIDVPFLGNKWLSWKSMLAGQFDHVANVAAPHEVLQIKNCCSNWPPMLRWTMHEYEGGQVLLEPNPPKQQCCCGAASRFLGVWNKDICWGHTAFEYLCWWSSSPAVPEVFEIVLMWFHLHDLCWEQKMRWRFLCLCGNLVAIFRPSSPHKDRWLFIGWLWWWLSGSHPASIDDDHHGPLDDGFLLVDA